MKFAKIVFWTAGAWGVLVLTPLYFLYDFVGRQDPPALNHPQLYYGFAGVGLAWQFAFMAIGTFLAYEFGRGTGAKSHIEGELDPDQPIATDPSN